MQLGELHTKEEAAVAAQLLQARDGQSLPVERPLLSVQWSD